MSKKASVLIVEDEKILRDAYELILSTKGFDVLTAQNGVEGLAQLKKIRPAVMLLDIFMPVMDGQEVLRNLDKAEYPDTKIVVCSNLSDNAVIQEVLRNGADKFVLKSNLGPQEMVKLVGELAT